MANKFDFEKTLKFSGEKKILAKNFTNGMLTVFCGGADFDLRGMTSKAKDIHLTIDCIMGGIRLTLPEGWNVDIDVESRGAGVISQKPAGDKKAPTFHLHGKVSLGGVEIL